MAVGRRIAPRLRRTARVSVVDAGTSRLTVRPSVSPRVPGGLGSATFGALAQVRECVAALVELDEDRETSDEEAALLQAVDALEQEVRRLVAASAHAAERVRRREHLEDRGGRGDALRALRRAGGPAGSTVWSG
jgi:hypothetical protein